MASFPQVVDVSFECVERKVLGFHWNDLREVLAEILHVAERFERGAHEMDEASLAGASVIGFARRHGHVADFEAQGLFREVSGTHDDVAHIFFVVRPVGFLEKAYGATHMWGKSAWAEQPSTHKAHEFLTLF